MAAQPSQLRAPLRFHPRFVPKMWGGRRLAEHLGKPLPPEEPIGESWELYDFPPGVVGGSENDAGWISAAVADGPSAGRTLHDLMQSHAGDLLGEVRPVETDHGPQFPILIKVLDAEQDLSVQVHPDEQYAASHPGAHLKNEAWHVLAHEPGARLLKGLEPGTSRRSFEQAIADGTIERYLRAIPAVAGETHYLPSGTVHALGAGMLVAEVQTPSDTTYRVYDFKRIDPSTGRERQLHVEQALECIDFESAGGDPHPPVSGEGTLVEAPQFTLSKRSAEGGAGCSVPEGQPVVLIFVGGAAAISGRGFEPVRAGRGQTLLLPAALGRATIEPQGRCEWLEVTFPPG